MAASAGSQAVSAITAQRTIGGGSEHRGTGRTETVEQGAAGKEEHHYLGCDR
jgi:hypothetical protein